jgi:hypothetical protein
MMAAQYRRERSRPASSPAIIAAVIADMFTGMNEGSRRFRDKRRTAWFGVLSERL